MTFYRLLSVLVNIFCAVLAMITLFGIMYAIAYPAALLQCFLFAGTVLYGFFANRFNIIVLQRSQKMSKRQKDWLQVNAIVAFIFSILGITNAMYFYANPDIFDEVLKQVPKEVGVTQHTLMNISTGLLVCCSILIVHIIWTYMLVRKHAVDFES